MDDQHREEIAVRLKDIFGVEPLAGSLEKEYAHLTVVLADSVISHVLTAVHEILGEEDKKVACFNAVHPPGKYKPMDKIPLNAIAFTLSEMENPDRRERILSRLETAKDKITEAIAYRRPSMEAVIKWQEDTTTRLCAALHRPFHLHGTGLYFVFQTAGEHAAKRGVAFINSVTEAPVASEEGSFISLDVRQLYQDSSLLEKMEQHAAEICMQCDLNINPKSKFARKGPQKARLN